MLVRLCTLLLLLAVAMPAKAQDRLRVGAKFGVTSAELRTDDFGYERRLGLNAGVFAVLPVHGPFGALAEVDYHRKGYKVQGEIRDETNTVAGSDPDFQYDYASLLVAPRYRGALGSEGMIFYAFVGPRLDVLLGDRVVATLPDGDRETIETDLVGGGEFESMVLGATTGIGLDLSGTMSVPLLVELRYDADVTPAQQADFGEWRFRTFGFRAGFSF